MDFDNLSECLFQILLLCRLVIMHCHGKLPCINFNHVWNAFEQAAGEESPVLSKVRYSECGRHDDKPKWKCLELALLPFFQCLFTSSMGNSRQQRNKNVRIERPFVCFVDYDDGVVLQKEIGFYFLQEDTVCHELDAGLVFVEEL